MPTDLYEKLKLLIASQELRKKNARSSMSYTYEDYKDILSFCKDIQFNNKDISTKLKSELEAIILNLGTMRIFERL